MFFTGIEHTFQFLSEPHLRVLIWSDRWRTIKELIPRPYIWRDSTNRLTLPNGGIIDFNAARSTSFFLERYKGTTFNFIDLEGNFNRDKVLRYFVSHLNKQQEDNIPLEIWLNNTLIYQDSEDAASWEKVEKLAPTGEALTKYCLKFPTPPGWE